MAMKKNVHYNHLSDFMQKKVSASADNTKYTIGGGEVQEGTPDIKYSQIVFIKDAQKIWTHGQIYEAQGGVKKVYLTQTEYDKLVADGEVDSSVEYNIYEE